jgi:hypothetical protein
LGDDGAPYRDRMTKLHIAQDGVRTVTGSFTAQAFIITDLDDNQITAFHPGAMNSSHENSVSDVAGIELGIVAPDGREGMRSHVEQFANANIPFIFDPGQGLPLFSGPELLEMIDASTFVAVNDYEGRLLAERTGESLDGLARRVDAIVETLGGDLTSQSDRHRVDRALGRRVVDPLTRSTECGGPRRHVDDRSAATTAIGRHAPDGFACAHERAGDVHRPQSSEHRCIEVLDPPIAPDDAGVVHQHRKWAKLASTTPNKRTMSSSSPTSAPTAIACRRRLRCGP